MKPDRLVIRAVNVFMQNLDANSSLMDPEALKELKIGTSGKFGGVGMVVNPKDGDYVVISPFEGTPAFKAGIKAGDIIMEIDGQSLHGLPLTEVLRKVRGPVGSTISVKVGNPSRNDPPDQNAPATHPDSPRALYYDQTRNSVSAHQEFPGECAP